MRKICDGVLVDMSPDEIAAHEADRPMRSNAALRAEKLSIIRSAREVILNRLGGIAITAKLTGDTATTAAYLTVRQALLDITQGLDTLPVDQIDSEAVARYAVARAACTAEMLLAFRQVDL